MAHFFKYLRTVGVTELVPHPPPAPPDGILLTHVPQFCVSDVLKESSCATAYVQDIPNCVSESINVCVGVCIYILLYMSIPMKLIFSFIQCE